MVPKSEIIFLVAFMTCFKKNPFPETISHGGRWKKWMAAWETDSIYYGKK